ncbi:MAG: hypothetical protein ACXW39_10885, partial [Nitrospira sp.]
MPIHTDGRIRSLQEGGAIARQPSPFIRPMIERNPIPCQFDDLLDSEAARLDPSTLPDTKVFSYPFDLGGQMREAGRKK